MNEWLLGGNIIIRVGAVVFLILFCINAVCWLSSKKLGVLPLGDFIIVGLFAGLIFLNQESLKEFSGLMPDVFNIALNETNSKINDFKRDVSAARKAVKTATTNLQNFASGETIREMEDRLKYTVPK